MSSADASTPLTAEERALVLSVPGLVERAAYEVLHRYGQLLPFKELASMGHFAVVLAAKSYDPAHGVPFAQWAFYRASHAMLDGARKERRDDLRNAARAAAMSFLARERRSGDDDPFAETDETIRERLANFSDGVVAALLDGANQRSMTAEDAALANEAWTQAAAGLRAVIAELSPEQREIIEFCYVNGENLKRAAELQGVNYFTLLDRHQALLKLMGARLRRRGVQEMPATEPPWPVLEGLQGARHGE